MKKRRKLQVVATSWRQARSLARSGCSHGDLYAQWRWLRLAVHDVGLNEPLLDLNPIGKRVGMSGERSALYTIRRVGRQE